MTPNSLGIQVEEEHGRDPHIARFETARTAFVGRTLRGPVNRPVLLNNFAEFQHAFGGLWQPSPLGYAVEHFFDNGGREALIVRVVNAARAATLTLQAGSESLRLRAVRPGTREFLRASVDYDNLAASDRQEFNLTVQRVRLLGTEQVEDQEIFPRVTLRSQAERFLGKLLRDSQLVEIAGKPPQQRPNRTLDAASGLASGYVLSNGDGDDGAPLTDYDLIGSEVDKTGVFALDKGGYFNFLCMPPLSRDQDVGLSALLVAARYCKERRALLIVDPPAEWHTADDALRAMREWPLPDENAVMYFPRILAHDKLRGHFEAFAPCGAVAGLLARSDEISPVWGPAKIDDAILRPGFRPSCLVAEDRRMRLASLGVNTIQAVRTAARIGVQPRTLAAGHAGAAEWQNLASRRLALFIVNSIERGTRWVLPLEERPDVAEHAAAWVTKFFEGICEAGAFGDRPMSEAFFVVCDAQMNSAQIVAAGEFHLLIGFAATRRREFHCVRICHSASGSKVRPASVNRFNFAQLEWVEQLAQQFES